MTEDSASAHTDPSHHSILVVDDTNVVRYTVFRFLSEVGYRVFEAGSAVEALEVLQTAKPPIGLVIVDVVMPSIGGVDLARMIRDRWPGVGIIFMSAYEAQVLAQEGLENLQVLFLAKPFTREELLAKVAAGLKSSGKTNGDKSHSGRPF